MLVFLAIKNNILKHFKAVPQEGDSLTFRTGLLMCLFGVGEIIFSLKFRGLKCAAIFGLEFGESEIIWALIFLVCHCPNHFLSFKDFFSKLDN